MGAISHRGLSAYAPEASPVPMKVLLKTVAAMIVLTSLSGCLTKRTVTRGGQTVSEGYHIKRPLKEAVENSN